MITNNGESTTSATAATTTSIARLTAPRTASTPRHSPAPGAGARRALRRARPLLVLGHAPHRPEGYAAAMPWHKPMASMT